MTLRQPAARTGFDRQQQPPPSPRPASRKAADGLEAETAERTGLIARRLGEVEARLAELARARDQLAALAERAAAQDPADCRGYCSIIGG